MPEVVRKCVSDDLISVFLKKVRGGEK